MGFNVSALLHITTKYGNVVITENVHTISVSKKRHYCTLQLNAEMLLLKMFTQFLF